VRKKFPAESKKPAEPQEPVGTRIDLERVWRLMGDVQLSGRQRPLLRTMLAETDLPGTLSPICHNQSPLRGGLSAKPILYIQFHSTNFFDDLIGRDGCAGAVYDPPRPPVQISIREG
jgi:hypothetical protein